MEFLGLKERWMEKDEDVGMRGKDCREVDRGKDKRKTRGWRNECFGDVKCRKRR